MVAIDLTLLGQTDDMSRLAAAAAREARLSGAALVVTHVEALADRGPSRSAAGPKPPVLWL